MQNVGENMFYFSRQSGTIGRPVLGDDKDQADDGEALDGDGENGGFGDVGFAIVFAAGWAVGQGVDLGIGAIAGHEIRQQRNPAAEMDN